MSFKAQVSPLVCFTTMYNCFLSGLLRHLYLLALLSCLWHFETFGLTLCCRLFVISMTTVT